MLALRNCGYEGSMTTSFSNINMDSPYLRTWLLKILLLLLSCSPGRSIDISQCIAPLGMESRAIPDADITASSSFDSGNVGPHHGRKKRKNVVVSIGSQEALCFHTWFVVVKIYLESRLPYQSNTSKLHVYFGRQLAMRINDAWDSKPRMLNHLYRPASKLFRRPKCLYPSPYLVL
ncbi:hypothetical protein M0804_015087 [Polistes exclamans]|nr:hypothetical protein M0804_015087 [Polistes exclamans]